jgi:SAM-dependent methyltransferase
MTKNDKRDTDSKALWRDVHSRMPHHQVTLGRASAAAYVSDPRMIAFIAARYKFVSKMLQGVASALEAGCGDGFGAPIVAQSVGRLVCTDIDEETLADNAKRLTAFKNIEFRYFDFRAARFPDDVDAAFAVDVVEHLFPGEEAAFLANLAASLTPHGVALFGTPNLTADQYASEYSRLGHVNLKDQRSLCKSVAAHFHNVFLFSMNDEVVHTGFYPMAHYLWALCVGPKRA